MSYFLGYFCMPFKNIEVLENSVHDDVIGHITKNKAISYNILIFLLKFCQPKTGSQSN